MTGELPARFWRSQLCHIPAIILQVLPLPRCLAPPPLSTSTGHLTDLTFARPFTPTLASCSLDWCAGTPHSLFTTRPCPRYRRLPPRQEWGALLSIALAAAALSCSLSVADGAGPLCELPSMVLAPIDTSSCDEVGTASIAWHLPWVHPDCHSFAPDARIRTLDPTRACSQRARHLRESAAVELCGSRLALVAACLPTTARGPAWRHHPRLPSGVCDLTPLQTRCHHRRAWDACASVQYASSLSSTQDSSTPRAPHAPRIPCATSSPFTSLAAACVRSQALHYLASPRPPDTLHIPYDYAGFIHLGALVLTSPFYGASYVVCALCARSLDSARTCAERQCAPRNTSLGMLCAAGVRAELTARVIDPYGLSSWSPMWQAHMRHWTSRVHRARNEGVRTSYGVHALCARFLDGRPSVLYSPTAGARVWTRLRYLPTGDNGTHHTAPGSGDLARARSLHQVLFLLATTSSDVVCVHRHRAQLPLASLAQHVNGASTFPLEGDGIWRGLWVQCQRDKTAMLFSSGPERRFGAPRCSLAITSSDCKAVFLRLGAPLLSAPRLRSAFAKKWGIIPSLGVLEDTSLAAEFSLQFVPPELVPGAKPGTACVCPCAHQPRLPPSEVSTIDLLDAGCPTLHEPCSRARPSGTMLAAVPGIALRCQCAIDSRRATQPSSLAHDTSCCHSSLSRLLLVHLDYRHGLVCVCAYYTSPQRSLPPCAAMCHPLLAHSHSPEECCFVAHPFLHGPPCAQLHALCHLCVLVPRHTPPGAVPRSRMTAWVSCVVPWQVESAVYQRATTHDCVCLELLDGLGIINEWWRNNFKLMLYIKPARRKSLRQSA
ncbi:hypothetical protein DFH08DRAFT_958178 [Mycena albidolilacea]|uniref:Uncharacterized protein n=1 Tax=Mycena albidolilacea TaxID=1033008 RepID=A0AAD7A6D6_9AGAR|nr:hypothetical protein DFH08DRAFT_958178 [Mycena albidolilacea]